MKVKIDSLKVKELTANSLSEKEKLNNEINYWLKEIELLKSIWISEEAEEFYENSTTYLRRLKVVSETYDVVGNFINGASNNYQSVDETTKNNFKKFEDKDVDIYVENNN